MSFRCLTQQLLQLLQLVNICLFLQTRCVSCVGTSALPTKPSSGKSVTWPSTGASVAQGTAALNGKSQSNRDSDAAGRSTALQAQQASTGNSQTGVHGVCTRTVALCIQKLLHTVGDSIMVLLVLQQALH